MEKQAISVLAALNAAIEKGAPPPEVFRGVVETIEANLEVEAVLLEVSGAKGEAKPQLFQAGNQESQKLLGKLKLELLEKLFDRSQEAFGFPTDEVSFSIRRVPPLALRAFKIFSQGQRVGELSLLVKQQMAASEPLEVLFHLLPSQLGLMWPLIYRGEVKEPIPPPLYKRFREVGLDPRKLLLNLEEQLRENLKPEVIVIAFTSGGREYLRTLVLPENLSEEKPLLRAMPVANTSFGEVLTSRRPLLRSYTKRTIERIDDKLFADVGLSCGIILPVFSREKIIALFFVGSRDTEEFFEDDATYLEHLAGEAGEIIGNVVSFVNLKEAFEEFKRHHQEALRSQKMESIAETALTLNHEINNPLTAILGNTQLLLLRSESLEPEMVEKLKAIEHSCLRIQRVTQRLMTMAEPKAALYTEGRKMIDIGESLPSEGEDR